MAVYRLEGHTDLLTTDEAGVIALAEEQADFLNLELEDGEAEYAVTDVASAIEVLETVNIFATLA